mgnify:CR=1 FL=1
MSYMHIENLYRPDAQVILLFRRCYALEKVHGTSAHISWRGGQLHLSPGGESAFRFNGLFDQDNLRKKFAEIGGNITIFGEAYGGSQQSQAWRYGPNLKFIAFDVQQENAMGVLEWLPVPQAQKFVEALGLEFVPYVETPTDLEALDALRDAASTVAINNGVPGVHPREGVVLRPLIEVTYQGERVIAKHKRHDERETATPRKVVDPAQLVVLTEATAIAKEWVTETRLDHVLQKFPSVVDLRATPKVIAAMTEDVLREGSGEFVDSKEVRTAIASATGKMFKARIQQVKL